MLTELNESGAKHRTFVYAGNQVLAVQEVIPFYGSEGVTWEHRDPSNATFRRTFSTGEISEYAELDPTGADAGIAPPLIEPTQPNENDDSLLPYPSFSDARHPGVTYAVDGIRVPVDYFMQQLDSAFHWSLGLVEASANASRRIVGYRNSGVSWGRPFNASYDANGRLTSLHMGNLDSELRGVNYGTISAVYDNSWAFLTLLPQKPSPTAPAQPLPPGYKSFRTFTKDEQRAVDLAYNRALSALDANTECQDFFKDILTRMGIVGSNGDASETLQAIKQNGGFERGSRDNDIASTLPAGSHSTIAFHNPFFSSTVGNTTTMFRPDPDQSPTDARALTILHELAHAMYRNFHGLPFFMSSDELDRAL